MMLFWSSFELMASTVSGHFVKILSYLNEVNYDSRKEDETPLLGAFQARSGSFGDRQVIPFARLTPELSNV